MPEFDNQAMVLRQIHALVKNLTRNFLSWLEFYYDKNNYDLIQTKNHFDDIVEVYKHIFDKLYDFAYLD